MNIIDNALDQESFLKIKQFMFNECDWYWNDDIVPLAIKMGSIDENPSEKLQARVIDNYWSFMANIILSFNN